MCIGYRSRFRLAQEIRPREELCDEVFTVLSHGVALSIKQPWAALLAAGRKTIEVRTWPTSRRGTVFLHAAKISDPRPHGWSYVKTPALERDSKLLGGVIAVAELVDCITYLDAASFQADVARHLNHPSWFRLPKLHGFVFENLRLIPFQPRTGNTFFFPVSGLMLSAPPEPVIIIAPPESQEDNTHDSPHDTRPARERPHG